MKQVMEENKVYKVAQIPLDPFKALLEDLKEMSAVTRLLASQLPASEQGLKHGFVDVADNLRDVYQKMLIAYSERTAPSEPAANPPRPEKQRSAG